MCARLPGVWFDHFESLKLSPGSTLKLMSLSGTLDTGEAVAAGDTPAAEVRNDT